ncbi:MAG: prepilin peptidase [Firmicutes bacterium]|nr:prepilin peptidase [Peptoniphilus sp.]MDD7363862.1 prepilin peptidase [Bacillota bacterium]
MMGASIASFFNLFLERRERGEGWIAKRSHCDACGTEIGGLYLVPVFGYFLARGTCRCGARIPRRHPLTECFGGLVWVLQIHIMTIKGAFSYAYIVWITFLLYLALEDILFREVYTQELVVAFALSLLATFRYGEWHILSGLFMVALLAMIYFLFKRGFGEGDIYYGSLIALSVPGVWQTYLYFTASVCLAASMGAIYHVKYGLKDGKVPMYPFFLLGWSVVRYFF